MVFNVDVAAEFSARIVAGLVAGALIGIERERAKSAETGYAKELPGIRSFSLLGLYGALSSYIWIAEPMYGVYLSLLFIAGFIALLTVYMVYRTFLLRKGGITTYTVMAITYALGYLAGLGLFFESMATAIAAALLLAAKMPLGKLIEEVSYSELLSAFELGLIVFILGPMVYSSGLSIGKLSLWGFYVFFTLILIISFGSYIAVRIKGSEGIHYVALLGGFVNSEATLVNASQLCLELGERSRRNCIVSVTILDNTAMYLRNIILALAAAYTFLGKSTLLYITPYIALGLGIPSLAGLLLFAYLSHRTRTPVVKHKITLENPLNFSVAFRGALIYVVLMLIAIALEDLAGAASLIPFSMLGGLANAGATILSLFSVVSNEKLLASGVLIAAAFAALNKPIYARGAGLRGRVMKDVVVWCVGMALIPVILASFMIVRLI